MGVLTRNEIDEMGFLSVGKNPRLSRKASYYGCSNIQIGNNVRIDDFCVLSAGKGGINIEDYVHLAVYVSVIGAGAITLRSFCGISSRVSIYSSNDDYSGAFLTGPTVPNEYTNVNHEDVVIGRHVIIGSGTVILPGARLGDGAAVGALSLVTGNCDAFQVYAGVPATRIKNRKRDLLDLEKQLMAKECGKA